MGRLQRAASLIESLVEHLGLGDSMKLEQIKNRWHTLIGPPISLNTQPDFFKNAQLTINVSSNVWMAELRFHKDTIVSKLKDFGVASIRLRPGPVEWSNQLTEPELPDAVLSAGEIAYVESLSADIKDVELREALRRTALKSFARIKTVSGR
ncbi:DUF721 domain-containing protein [Candidatus Magnetominusculus xianensis]|uniref:Protein containing DUF721 n=1 Tax=Candidatus Magnetominusculus xianensis TaxID=1748249 RepID=A0ABR5SJL8_9BACT|nr:DUF721 domain-containing protein [Candidatus Magnetominusculus xianensis]KWT94672.1 hypothetical protein ASN18_0211 [Candidatus Magnetominusculus xianensis]MBF0403384.1 DUF721 domain-containing protein [Nitrospirota bacterium]